MTYYIGLMSGTSADGIDTALVDWTNDSVPIIVQTHQYPIAPELRQQVYDFAISRHDEINRMRELDYLMGQLFSDAVIALCRKSNLSPAKIEAIGSHGQTIRHCPPESDVPGYSLQIGDPNVITERTGITTVADFRRRDIAAGGQGAPLAPALHQALFHHPQKNRVILNTGGIANITWLAATGDTLGFDTGPANGLMDSWCQLHLRQAFDCDGQWASSGKVHRGLLSQLLRHPYLALPYPKSTGREMFNLPWLQGQLDLFEQTIAPVDVQATLLAFTTETIIAAINNAHMAVDEVFICGGGAHNQALCQQLQSRLGSRPLASTTALGIDPDWVEAVAFSWLAKQTLARKAGNLPDVTGAHNAVVLGGVYWA